MEGTEADVVEEEEDIMDSELDTDSKEAIEGVVQTVWADTVLDLVVLPQKSAGVPLRAGGGDEFLGSPNTKKP